MSEQIKSTPAPYRALWVALGLIALFVAITLAPAVLAADGDLDTSFDTDGLVTTNSGSNDEGNGIAVQTDGKIVVAGTNGATFVVIRYNTDGSLDTSFGGTGVVSTNFGSTDKAYGVVIQPDGKIVAAGYSGNDFALARYETNGTLDTTFGANGLVTTDFNALPGSYASAGGYAVALDSNGRIIVVGYVQNGSQFEDWAVVRYDSDGSLDETFNPTGSFTPGVPGIVTTIIQQQEPERAYAVAIQSDDKIVVVGETKGSPGQFAMTRYNTDGGLDTTLAGDGSVLAASNKVGPGRGVAVQDDGMIVVTGRISVINPTSQNCIDSAGKYCEYYDFWVARFTSLGAPDNNFGAAGEVATPINERGNDDDGRAVVIQPDGKIVVAGYTDSSIHTFSGEDESFTRRPDFALARYMTNGTLDSDFGTGGTVITDFTPGVDDEGSEAYAIALQSDGKILAAGASRRDFAVARYDSGPTPTTTAIINHVPDPSEVGEQVSIFIMVTSASGVSPTGNVTITDGDVSCNGPLVPGIQGTGPSGLDCVLTFTTPGTKTLTATYDGSAEFSSSSDSVTHTVTETTKQDTSTTITSHTPDPSSVNQPVVVTYAVNAFSGTPTGDVTVSDGTDSCTATVAAGSCNLVMTTPGSKTLTATYGGDADYNGSSGTASHTVTDTTKQNTTTTILSNTPNPSQAGQPVVVTYAVNAFSGTPTGDVTVSDGTVSCTAAVAAGTCTLTPTTPGTKTLTATYSGDAAYNGSSGTTTHTVQGTTPQPTAFTYLPMSIGSPQD